MTIIRLVLCFSLAVRIHRGNGFVAAGVRDSIGKGFFGRYSVGELCRAVWLQGKCGIVQRNASNGGQDGDFAIREKRRERP